MKKQNIKKTVRSDRLLTQLVSIEAVVNKLPELSPLEKVKLDNSRAIDELYYSSKLEGTALNQKRIEQAIYGKGLSAA